MSSTGATSDPALAIVIPGYKGRYLQATLQSIAAQTDQRFRLYVFDDGSPEDLGAIFRAENMENAAFHRFEQNIGGRSVVESWRRCVAQTREPWVWLFSDDDLMHPGCVAAFHRALEQDGDAFNVYRFNTLVINQDGNVTRINQPNPELESAAEFIYHRLTSQRESLAPEHIFRRSAYDARGGFVEFPFALGSDDATWINLAGTDTLLRCIAGPRVCWRLSDINISSLSSGYVDKLLGLLAYAQWLLQRPGDEIFRTVDGRPAVFELRGLVRKWFLTQLRRCRHVFSVEEARVLARETSAKLGILEWHVWLVLLRSNLYFVWDFAKRPIS